MPPTRRWLSAAAVLLALAAVPAAAQEPAARQDAMESLQAEIQSLKPPDHVWRALPWKTCPLEALAAARESHKPLILWVFIGTPADERC